MLSVLQKIRTALWHCAAAHVMILIAATVAVITGGVSLLIFKNIFLVSLLPLVVHGPSDTSPDVTATVAAVGVRRLFFIYLSALLHSTAIVCDKE
jgi:hypothetical protein